MNFTPLALPGMFLIDLALRKDERGFFARTFCQEEFANAGLQNRFVQCNISGNVERATLRGMHYQMAPSQEVKVVRCLRGAIYDVVIDIRQDSPTYGQHLGVELTDTSYRMLYVPEGMAHGYQALAEGTEVFYMVSAFYAPQHEKGIRWNDPAFGVEWPLQPPILSDKDRSHANFVL